MARAASEHSGLVILTSDNPRTESPEAILDEMQEGLTPEQRYKAMRISDRREAIKTACNLAQPNDIILLAGKGHEKYQEINGIKHPFDDSTELENALKNTPK
jgi:UDP-N-acetylmuramoyl-L-alanyl-D-glutamate--2,6-diaminopimelate ligase